MSPGAHHGRPETRVPLRQRLFRHRSVEIPVQGGPHGEAAFAPGDWERAFLAIPHAEPASASAPALTTPAPATIAPAAPAPVAPAPELERPERVIVLDPAPAAVDVPEPVAVPAPRSAAPVGAAPVGDRVAILRSVRPVLVAVAPTDAAEAAREVLSRSRLRWLTAREIAERAQELGWQPAGADPVARIRTVLRTLASDGAIERQMRTKSTAEFRAA
jgi:hypothetical protein